MSGYTVSHIAGIFVLLCLSFFFAAAETSLFSLSRFQTRELEREYPRRGHLIARMLSNPSRLLISILTSNMFVNVFSSVLGESLMRHLVPGAAGTFLAIVVMGFAILVMGEVVPKTLAIQFNQRFSLLVAPAIERIDAFQAPLRRAVRAVSDRIISLFSRSASPGEQVITEEEIKTALRIGSREGVVHSREREMIHGVFRFIDMNIADLMIPRRSMVAFDLNAPPAAVEEAIRRGEYSRIPMYEETLDGIRGILYAKDLLGSPHPVSAGGLRALIRPAYFVPETMSASSLLREFRRRKMHLAVVVDEYGVVAGLITLEDLLEEIIGDIRDKKEAVPLFRKAGRDSFAVGARMGLAEFNRRFGCDIRDATHATIGGYLSSRIGVIPREGYRLRHGELVITISSADKNRIREILVSRGAPA